jgi:site-specific recombinase XerD
MVGLGSTSIAEGISALRQYFWYLYLNRYTFYPIAMYLPHAPQRLRLKLPTVWTENEIESLVNAVDMTNSIGKRDYAMILLGARLGLCSGDISNLKLDDIDWSNKEITVLQSKTIQELVLPLPNDVGWAIIDYLKNGRPVTECKNVFVVHNAPYTGCIYEISSTPEMSISIFIF